MHLQMAVTATPAEFLAAQRATIVERAQAALTSSHAHHYDSADSNEVRERLETLFELLLQALAARDLGPVLRHARQVARERFTAGYDLSEVQIAFNALEEATWERVFSGLPADRLAEALGLVGTVFGAAKDALAREYVALATRAQAPSLDLQHLFMGTD